MPAHHLQVISEFLWQYTCIMYYAIKGVRRAHLVVEVTTSVSRSEKSKAFSGNICMDTIAGK